MKHVLIWLLKAYRFDGDRLATTPVAKGAVGSRGSPGGALTISADGKKPATGIVWGTLTVSRSADHGHADVDAPEGLVNPAHFFSNRSNCTNASCIGFAQVGLPILHSTTTSGRPFTNSTMSGMMKLFTAPGVSTRN